MYLFPARDCIKFCPVFNFVSEEGREGEEREREKKTQLGGCTAHAGGCREPKALYLCFGWQRVFSSAWHRQSAVVFGTSVHPSCPPRCKLSASPSQPWCILHVWTGRACVCACVWKSVCTTPPALVYTLGSTAANANYRFKVAASGFYQYFIRLTFFFYLT